MCSSEPQQGANLAAQLAKAGLSDKDLKMASVERIHWIQPGEGKKKNDRRDGFFKNHTQGGRIRRASSESDSY